ncbi:MAG: DNA-formamidopyrimidine glycosylase family protein [Planctomycetota bacterium]
MPELPEVETIVGGLRKQIVGKRIARARVILSKIVKGNARDFITQISGSTIKKIWRRGKMIVIDLADGKNLLIHLKMSGQLIFCSSDAPMTKHTHLIFELSDSYQLRYLDMRQFGYLCLADDSMVQKLIPSGAEPLEISRGEFKRMIPSRKTRIKSLLLDQSFLAGIGNIYADEILHKAGIHPQRHSHTLSAIQITKLYQAIQDVLRQAIVYEWEMRKTTTR